MLGKFGLNAPRRSTRPSITNVTRKRTHILQNSINVVAKYDSPKMQKFRDFLKHGPYVTKLVVILVVAALVMVE